MPLPIAQELQANTLSFEQQALIKTTGFREYDARWIFGQELNLMGVRVIGMALGSLIHDRGMRPHIVVGNDYRSYSGSIKHALISGLMAAGCTVHDIGLCITPMAYFAQFALEIPAVAMVTASHNENGWTGLKMGVNPPLTFGPDDMTELKSRVMQGDWTTRPGGGLVVVEDFNKRYQQQFAALGKLSRKLRVGVICGNGTAGAFAPQALRAIGCDVVEVDCTLDHSFPKYNPNPEDLTMLQVMVDAVAQHGLDVAFGFDGDGDRCGVVDNQGRIVFADKMGLLLARDLATQRPGATFIVDIKSTGLFKSDPVLKFHGAKVEYWKTGHSHMKLRTQERDAVAGFEKSGHYFFRAPLGLGYDDAIVSAIAICQLLDKAPSKSLAKLYDELPPSFLSPSMSPHCDDERKYAVVDKLADVIATAAKEQQLIAGHHIATCTTLNGIRFELTDGSWGLIRASSNKPELVVVCESLKSDRQMREIFRYIEGLLERVPEVGRFNQKI